MPVNWYESNNFLNFYQKLPLITSSNFQPQTKSSSLQPKHDILIKK